MFRNLVVCLLMARAAGLAQPAGSAMRLTLRRAIETALANRANPDLRIAQESERIAEARQAQGRAVMLPALESSVAGQNQTRNIAAQGFRFETPVPGFTIPESVGPFNTMDARVSLTQPVLDLSALRRLRAASARTIAAGADVDRQRDELAAQVARAYARVLRDDAELEAAESTIARARATLASVRNRVDAGSTIGIEIKRAEYQLIAEEQRRAELRGDREHALLALLDAMGLGFDARVELEDRLRVVEPQTAPVETALQARRDLAAQRKREESLRLDAEALRLETLPTIAAYADAGVLGRQETHTIGLMMRIPVFDGGRRKAREAEAGAMLRQESARAAKLERAVELQVRQAQVRLRTAAQQVTLAGASMSLADAEWEHARRRHEAGIAGVVEVLEAQSRLASAARQRVEALYRYTEVRIDALYAAGGIRDLAN